MVAVGGNENHRRGVLQTVKRLRKLKARGSRHRDIKKNHVDTILHEHLNSRANTRSLVNQSDFSSLLKQKTQLRACGRFVVNDHRT